MRLLPALILALALPACAASSPVLGGRPLRLVSWNVEHLAERDGAGCRPRSGSEYAALRRQVDHLNADVVAFQEIESPAAAARVFDPVRFVVVMEDRPPSPPRACGGRRAGRMRTSLGVGFAIRRNLAYVRAPDVSALGLGDPERPHGVDVVLLPPGHPPLRLLAVHLQPGCFTALEADRCGTLLRQAATLRGWIMERARARERFVILGDFNRDIAAPGDPVRLSLTRRVRTAARAAIGMRPSFCARTRRSFIDHILLGGGAQQDFVAFYERIFLPGFRKPSDHCPIGVTLAA